MKPDLEGLALRANPDAVCITAATGELLHWSPGAESTFGYRAAEAIGQSLRRLLVPESEHDAYRRIVADALRGERVVYESACRRKDGSLIRTAGTCTAVRDAHASDYLLFAQKDVTALRVEQQASALARDYGELLEAMPDGTVLVNPTGQIVRANAQAEKMFGYERGELQGKGVECLLPPRLRADHLRRRADYFAQPHLRTMGADLEMWGLRKNGSEFPIDVSLNPLRTDAGILAISAIRDVTERKRVELVLASKNMELEKARDAHVLHTSISHALRTRLNSIIGFSGTLLMQLPGPLNEEQQRQLGTIKSSAHDLLQSIDGALGISTGDMAGRAAG
jgi:PAS domain S-box-containing protein